MVATDLGAINSQFMSTNYTNEQYKVNEWYNAWLPDTTKRQDSKTTYTVQIAYSNGTNETWTWHGPPAGILSIVYTSIFCFKNNISVY